MSKNDYGAVITARRELEEDFINMAFAGLVVGTVEATDLLAICPLDRIQTPIPRALYRCIDGLVRQGKAISPPGMWEFAHAAMLGNDPKAEPWPQNFSASDIGRYAFSIHEQNRDAILHAAERVAAEGAKRNTEAKLMALLGDCQRYGNDPAEIASGLAAVAAELDGGAPVCPDLSELMGRVIGLLENGAASKPLPTPWPELNRVLKGGLVPGELAILAARPGMGKTALAGCLAVETARNGVPVLFISREVKDVTLASRFLAREGRIDARLFRQGVEHSPQALPAVREAAVRLSGLPLSVVEKSIAPMSPREVRRLAKTTKGVGLVIVDYLQLLNPDTKQSSREREVAEMSRAMKQLALDCDCPVLLLSQLNRRVEEGDRVPQLSDLRESGAIEQDADIVMFLHARKANQGLPKMPVQAIVAKGRSSGTGTAHLIFDKPYADFVEDSGAAEWAMQCAPVHGGNDL